MAAAVHGIFFGRVAPSSAQRARIEVPALVVGHPADPIHPAADAAMLADELPNATLRPGPQHPGVARRARAARHRWRPTSRARAGTPPRGARGVASAR